MSVEQKTAHRLIRKNVPAAWALIVAIVSGGVGSFVGGTVGFSKGYSEGQSDTSRATSTATEKLATGGIKVNVGDGARKKSVVRPVPEPTDALIKFIVAREVERRENVAVQVQNVTITSPGVAHTVFEGGSAEVYFRFTDAECPDASKTEYRACLDEIVRNPTGFKVIDYAAQQRLITKS